MDAKRVHIPSPEWDATASAVSRAMRLTTRLNKLSFDDAEEVRKIFSELIGKEVDDTFKLIPHWPPRVHQPVLHDL
jgi:hypothetical protein